MTKIYLNQIATAVPEHDIHKRFSDYVPTQLKEARVSSLFKRMAARCQIEHRYSFLKADPQNEFLDDSGFYRQGNFPDTGERMKFFQAHAFSLVCKALDQLDLSSTTHVIVTSCTGFYAPGMDLQIVEHYKLKAETERTMIGFMGCYAAFNGLKLAWHIVRSVPQAKVLIVNLELCTLHLQETDNIEQFLSYLIFADGCAASIISAQPQGLLLERFYSTIMPAAKEQITWTIGNSGFDMVLSGEVPATITQAISNSQKTILNNQNVNDVRYWAIHPGGRSVLDVVQKSFDLSDDALMLSRNVLRNFGNMSSATVMFVLRDIMAQASPAGLGCAMAFGPGVTLESMLFHKV